MREGISRLERFRGCLLGLAVGDAMGAPLTGMKSGHVLQVYGAIGGFVDAERAWKGKPHRWALRGLYTGNTQQALAVADILARDGDCDPRVLAGVFLEMAEAAVEGRPTGCHRRAGKSFRLVLERIRAGEPGPLDCGGSSAGCGAVARAAPFGLFFSNAPDRLWRAVVENTLLTHRDPRSVAAALAVARVVARWVSEAAKERMQPSEMARVLADQIRLDEDAMAQSHGRHLIRLDDPAARHHVSESIALLSRLLEEGDDRLAWESIVRQANRCGPKHPIHDPSQGFAPACLTTALYLGLGGRSFEEAMGTALALGREASDLGSLVGAIVGARDGSGAIPAPWLAGLHNADQVRLRADHLDRGAIDYSSWRGIVEMESEATALEERERRRLAALWEKRGELVVKKRPKAKPRPIEPEPDLGFAPPPETWLRRKKRERSREMREQRRRKRSRDD